jgi:hypothetical protein
MVAFTTRIAGVALAAGLGLSVAPAQAGYVVTLTQEGTDVVATGSGPIDLTNLIYQDSAQDRGALVPKTATIITGPLSPDDYYTGLTGPTNFGSGFGGVASSNAGDIVGIGFGYLGTFTTTCFRCQKATSPTALYRTPRPIAVRRSAASA